MANAFGTLVIDTTVSTQNSTASDLNPEGVDFLLSFFSRELKVQTQGWTNRYYTAVMEARILSDVICSFVIIVIV